MKTAWVVVPAVAAAAALGFVAQRWTSMRNATPPVVASAPAGTGADSAASGAELPADEPPPLVIPDALPGFSLVDRDGKARTLADWAGRPVMVNYWATWCGPCRREIPLLNELRAEGRPAGLEVVGIAVDVREDVLAYATETTIDYPLLIGEEDGLEAVTAMGMKPAFPFTVFADSKQRILTVKMGELHRDEAEMILATLGEVDSGSLSLAQAKTQLDAGLKELATRRATEEAAESSPAG